MNQEEKNISVDEKLNRRLEGEVVSVSKDKTVYVLVHSRKMHPKYRKQYTTTRKYPVHDEKGEAVLGNEVIFEECRPLSKTKRWRLVKIVK
jgi:small subunit ribosomal protein S17